MSAAAQWVEVSPDALEVGTTYRVAYNGGSRPGSWRKLIPRRLSSEYVEVSYPEDAPGAPFKRHKRSRMTRVLAASPVEPLPEPQPEAPSHV